jgi:hypothetical protein
MVTNGLSDAEVSPSASARIDLDGLLIHLYVEYGHGTPCWDESHPAVARPAMGDWAGTRSVVRVLAIRGTTSRGFHQQCHDVRDQIKEHCFSDEPQELSTG